MATINTAAENTTLTLSYTAPTAKLSNFIDDALNYLYPQGYDFDEDGVNTLVADMTNAQKAGLIEAKCKAYIKSCAEAHHIVNAERTARETAEADTTTRYE